MRDDERYTYTQAGFNGFFRRTLSSSSTMDRLSSRISGGGVSRTLNFDQMQVSGSMGDKFRIGSGDTRIEFDGPGLRISFIQGGNEVGRLGDLDG